MAERRFWLMKSEPSDYSFDDLLAEEGRSAEWDGVRNYAARNTMRDDMRVGDGVLFYHSNAKPSAVVGYATVVKAGYPDFTAWDPESEGHDPKSDPDNPTWYMVDIRAENKFRNPVTLPQIKAHEDLREMTLVKNSRLSVQPVANREWKIILTLGMSADPQVH